MKEVADGDGDGDEEVGGGRLGAAADCSGDCGGRGGSGRGVKEPGWKKQGGSEAGLRRGKEEKWSGGGVKGAGKGEKVEGARRQIPDGLRSKQAAVQTCKGSRGRGAGGAQGQRCEGSRDGKGRDGKRQRCEGGREAKGRDVNERGAKGEVKREGYKGEGCKGRVAKRRDAKERGGQDGECKEARCRRAEMRRANAPRGGGSCCQAPPGPEWALVAPRALGSEAVARRALGMRGSQWSRGLCTAPAGKEEPGKLKMCGAGKLLAPLTHFSHFR